MKYSLYDRLLARELGNLGRAFQPRGIYGDRQWVDSLEITHELKGHVGCVNALSWSKNGQLLASGSDDTHLNIHNYQADSTTSPFSLTTTIATGHTANIFSVQFMPHSNNRKLVTAAGDHEIRIFDIEYSTQSSAANTCLKSEADTNVKVFRSHSDRVKRLVTESSPFFFLSCSEDGEVRQWDIRQPSSAYPRARVSQTTDHDDSVPPPLISYKRHQLDINSISCSASQPYYIALAGAHPHCFLHDRRMLGRDKLLESGATYVKRYTDHADDLMAEATQCVRRFAPRGMTSSDHGHITACKISDSHPNELVASWSGDWIYSFDILQTPDAREKITSRTEQSNIRKRKRATAELSTLEEIATTQVRDDEEEVALRVNYGNGQSENIPLSRKDNIFSEDLRVQRIASGLFKIKEQMLGICTTEQDYSSQMTTYPSMIDLAASVLDDMDAIIRGWRYPLVPTPTDIFLQRKFRADRAKTRRFVQASGTIARLLGVGLQAVNHSNNAGPLFDSIETTQDEFPDQFYYDFLKAIVSWSSSGPSALVEAFSRDARTRRNSRLPIPENASIEAIDDFLIPYLLEIAGTRPLVNVDSSKFEIDTTRWIFRSEKLAVQEFANAVKIPFEDLGSVIGLDAPQEVQDRNTALRYWGLTVARSLLFRCARDLTYHDVEVAYGGSGRTPGTVKAAEAAFEQRLVYGNKEFPDGIDEDDEDSDDEDRFESDSEHGFDSDEEADNQATDPHARRARFPNCFAYRMRVQPQAALMSHQMCYKGAANVQTVKDVNFYGIDDEYVVSGSDSGHVFIWDRATGTLLNILYGDNETVNVVQGHPYEPMLAVSGIDNTIKILSADSRARQEARLGIWNSSIGSLNLSEIRRERTRGNLSNIQRAPASNAAENNELGTARADPIDDDDETYIAPGGLPAASRMSDRHGIMSENEELREGSTQTAFGADRLLAILRARLNPNGALATLIRRNDEAGEGETEDDENEGETEDDEDEDEDD